MPNNPTPAISSRAFVLHQAQFGNDESTFAILAHDIHHQNGQSALGPGKPFGHDEKASLIGVLSSYMGSNLEFLDAKCLASSHETLMWYRPRQITTINLNGTETNTPIPSLIFLAHKGKLFVAAYKGERRPERSTKLLHCALPNIMSNLGSWCSGGNNLPDQPAQHHIERIEAMFFRSPFTHWGHTSPCSNDTSIADFFSELSKKRAFPMSQLEEMGCTTNEWLHHVTGKRNRL